MIKPAGSGSSFQEKYGRLGLPGAFHSPSRLRWPERDRRPERDEGNDSGQQV
jgi:hypothetical protein